jgi:hypothetical protein
MATNGMDVQVAASKTAPRRRPFYSGLAFRLLIAFVISWLIVLAFFATGAVSH